MRENERPALLTRRQILASSVAVAGTMPFLTKERAAAASEPRDAELRLTQDPRRQRQSGASIRPRRAERKPWHHALARPALSRRSCESGGHFHHHALARTVAALEAGRLSLAANAADPGGRHPLL